MPKRGVQHLIRGLGAWAGLGLTCGVAVLLDPHLDLANLAMVFVLACTLMAFWLPLWASVLFTLSAVSLFNWMFVSPRRSFHVEGQQNFWLLGTMMAVSLAISVLMERLRHQATLARRHARHAQQLQSLGESLRALANPQAMGQALYEQLQDSGSAADTPNRVSLMVLREERPARDEAHAAWWWGDDADTLSDAERIGLWLCLREGRPFGHGTPHHPELLGWYMPVRGPATPWGAALIRLNSPEAVQGRAHAQALCDLLGSAVHRLHLTRRTEAAQQAATTQALRSAMLTAIAHDFRTPLASILGAASSLEHQTDRLAPTQRQRLLAQIQQEARALSLMTDNTLQLVRLEGGLDPSDPTSPSPPTVELHRDWESLEELIGAVIGRMRQRVPDRTVRARVAADVPLLYVDAGLLTQLLDNLVDNALKYSDGPVDVVARPLGQEVLLAVQDRGPGVPSAERGLIFHMFQRGQQAHRPGRRRTGLGLAVCQAIAHVHQGRLSVRARQHGGSSFELHLPRDLAHAPPLPSITLPMP